MNYKKAKPIREALALDSGEVQWIMNPKDIEAERESIAKELENISKLIRLLTVVNERDLFIRMDRIEKRLRALAKELKGEKK